MTSSRATVGPDFAGARAVAAARQFCEAVRVAAMPAAAKMAAFTKAAQEAVRKGQVQP